MSDWSFTITVDVDIDSITSVDDYFHNTVAADFQTQWNNGGFEYCMEDICYTINKGICKNVEPYYLDSAPATYTTSGTCTVADSSSDDGGATDDDADSCSEITFETNLITANLGPAGNPNDDMRYVFRQSIVDSLYYIDSIDQVIITSEDPYSSSVWNWCFTMTIETDSDDLDAFFDTVFAEYEARAADDTVKNAMISLGSANGVSTSSLVVYDSYIITPSDYTTESVTCSADDDSSSSDDRQQQR